MHRASSRSVGCLQEQDAIFNERQVVLLGSASCLISLRAVPRKIEIVTENCAAMLRRQAGCTSLLRASPEGFQEGACHPSSIDFLSMTAAPAQPFEISAQSVGVSRQQSEWRVIGNQETFK